MGVIVVTVSHKRAQHRLHLTAFGVGGRKSIPCNLVLLQKYLPLQSAAGKANRWKAENESLDSLRRKSGGNNRL